MDRKRESGIPVKFLFLTAAPLSAISSALPDMLVIDRVEDIGRFILENKNKDFCIEKL